MDKIIFGDHNITEADILRFQGRTMREASKELGIAYEYFIRVIKKYELRHIFKEKKKESNDPFRKTIYIQPKTLPLLNGRKPSGVFNQTLQRMAIAGADIKITESDREFHSITRRSNYSPGYPDQGEILKKFAEQKGCDLSTALVCLEKIERE